MNWLYNTYRMQTAKIEALESKPVGMSNIRWGDQLNYYCEHELKYHGDVETY
jgi:hypothetical protein